MADLVRLSALNKCLCRTNAKSYETKQYKKGLKAADTILKKFPDHGVMEDGYDGRLEQPQTA
ncbi:hypothetical protein RJ639_047470 [Escallonia herrerae]|uniref:Uncharacterized protein n=1 Tax=Escallonia herrerae TaxID=1293975 RepID=A0AA88W6R7_9ASTE|nr:hypothetical protein RJ639_047470 [Escallonia herrerae]